jgi:hypothetical protein
LTSKEFAEYKEEEYYQLDAQKLRAIGQGEWNEMINFVQYPL